MQDIRDTWDLYLQKKNWLKNSNNIIFHWIQLRKYQINYQKVTKGPKNVNPTNIFSAYFKVVGSNISVTRGSHGEATNKDKRKNMIFGGRLRDVLRRRVQKFVWLDVVPLWFGSGLIDTLKRVRHMFPTCIYHLMGRTDERISLLSPHFKLIKNNWSY